MNQSIYLIIPDQTGKLALYLNSIRAEIAGFILRICRFEANPARLFKQCFQSCFLFVNQGNNDLTVAGCIRPFDDHGITLKNTSFNH